MTSGMVASGAIGIAQVADNNPAIAVLAGFALQICVLYLGGSYATSRALGLAGGAHSRIGRFLFYAFVMPGVMLHESAHYAACRLTGTRVMRFTPFAPAQDASGRVILGYVVHEKRPAPIMALIGLAPMIVNPAGILLVTAVFTPLPPTDVLNPTYTILPNLFASGFFLESPLVAVLWVYVLLSFAVGAVPSREDLGSLPAAAAVFITVLGVVTISGTASFDAIVGHSASVALAASALYAVPTAVAALAAALVALLRHASGAKRRGTR